MPQTEPFHNFVLSLGRDSTRVVPSLSKSTQSFRYTSHWTIIYAYNLVITGTAFFAVFRTLNAVLVRALRFRLRTVTGSSLEPARRFESCWLRAIRRTFAGHGDTVDLRHSDKRTVTAIGEMIFFPAFLLELSVMAIGP